MDIALLNKRVTFQKNSVVTDEIGNHLDTWTDWYSCMATITNESGSEERDAGEIRYEETLEFTVRCCRKTEAVTTTGYRIVMDDALYDIRGIDHFSYKRQALKFRCRRVSR